MHENLDTLCRAVKHAMASGADGADAMLFETVDVSLSRRLGKPEGIERSESKALGLRAFYGARQAIVSSTDLSQDTLCELAERVVAMAKAAPPDPDSTLAPSNLYPAALPDLDLCDASEPDNAWFTTQCKEAEEAALAVAGITNSEGADAHFSRSITCLAIADGKEIRFAHSYPSSAFSVSVSVLAGHGTAMERDYEYRAARHRQDLDLAVNIGKSAGERTVKRLNPRKVPTCQVPVVFDPRVSKGILGILANAISGSAIARGSSFLKDSLGKAIFPASVTITDDPLLRRGLASKPFDAEGVATAPLTVVEKGVLSHWFLDMRTANKLKHATTGHAARGLASPPSPSCTNLYLHNGTLSPTALMRDIKNGLYVTETFGMGVNLITGDYSQGACGFWIENGAITYPVSEITIAGKLPDMFASITPANDLTLRYTVNAPTLRVDGMTIAGA